jgi:hypothetical protein
MLLTGQVKLIRYTDADRKSLAHAAAVYLGKEDVENTRRPLSIIKKQDTLAIFRGEHARFEFWTSKVVYDHLVTYTTMEMRACAGLRANLATEFVPPVEVIGTEWEEAITRRGENALDVYQCLIEGIDPENAHPTEKVRLQAARSVAPVSVRLHYMIQFNLATLIEALFPQRLWTPGAQLDTHLIAREMFYLVSDQDPELWGLIEEYYGTEAQAWKRMYHRLRKDDPELVTQLLQRYPMKSLWDK